MAFYDVNLRALQMASRIDLDAVAFTVRRLTREPAEFFGLDVGTLEPGSQTDVTLVHPDNLATYKPEESVTSIWRDAFEHDQLVNRSPGVVPYVLIGGEVVWEEDSFQEVLGERALGRALRNRRAL
jgi:dihydroorotase-like cyclic amidohydrolase